MKPKVAKKMQRKIRERANQEMLMKTRTKVEHKRMPG